MSLGVWAPQGALSGFSANAANPNVLYDSNPVILSANPDGKIWKMWYAQSGSGISFGQGLSYAESADGVSWTQYGSNPLIATGTFGFPKVFKHGSTYYIYMTRATFASIEVYTSTDGVTLTDAGVALSAGSGWENNSIAQLVPIDVIGGVWYGFYTGNTSTFFEGIATSADGITWKNTGYPQIPITTSNMWPIKVGNTYYAWSQTNSGPIGGGISRYSATDPRGPWVQMGAVTYVANTAAEIGTVTPSNWGPADPSLLEVSGQVHLYDTITKNDGTSLGIAHSIASMTLAQLVQTSEGTINIPSMGSPNVQNKIASDTFVLTTQTASDNFTRANGGLGANWTTISTYNAPQIASNVVEAAAATAGAYSGALYTAIGFANDQFSSVVLKNVKSNPGYSGVVARATTNLSAYYAFYVTGPLAPGQVTFFLNKNGGNLTTYTVGAASVAGQTVNPGDTLTLVCVGTTIIGLLNGKIVIQGTDASIASGDVGFFVNYPNFVTDSQIGTWSGGTAAASSGANFTAFNSGTPGYGLEFASGQGGAYWSANSFASLNDQWATIKAKVANSTTSILAAGVRLSSSANTGYFAQWTGHALGGAGTLTIDKYLAGAHTVLKTATSVTVSAGSTISLAVVGTQLSAYVGGILMATASDSGISSGSPGFSLTGASTGTDAEISSFSAGVFNYSIGGNVGAAAQVTISDGTTTFQSDWAGNYIAFEPPGSVTLTPSGIVQNVYAFQPATLSVTISSAAVTGSNFLARKNGLVQTAIDNFVRADGGLGANWTGYTGFSAPALAAFIAQASVTGAVACAALYTGISFGNDQYSYCVINNALDASCNVGAFARLIAAGSHGYFWYAHGPLGAGLGTLVLSKNTGALTSYSLGANINTGQTLAVGDTLLLTVVGTTISGYHNGVLVAQGTDATFASGSPGMYLSCDTVLTQGQATLWTGGDSETAATYSISGALGAGGAGATVSWVGTTASGSVTADGSGNYSIPSLFPDTYTITPTLTNVSFTPVSRSSTVTNANLTGVNFSVLNAPSSGGIILGFTFGF